MLAGSSLISLLLLETCIALAARLNVFPIKVPSYSIQEARTSLFWRDMNPAFGVWHVPNSTKRHKQNCFDVTYRSNSYGARDSERSRMSHSSRVVVLGDSFVEGYAVNDEERFTSVLERQTGIEHLNFGTAGDFGTIQDLMLYRTLASGFSHSAVLITLLPENDFWDNDLEYGKVAHADRYRPYLVGSYPNYRLVYYQPSLDQSTFRDGSGRRAFGRRLLAEFTHTYNAYTYFSQLLLERPDATPSSPPSSTGRSTTYSGYYDFRPDQLDLMKYTLEQIKQTAGDRKVIIALLPSGSDFARYDPSRPVALSTELQEFASAHDMLLVDLLPSMYAQTNDRASYLLPCSGHWTAKAHAVAAQFLREALDSVYRDLAGSRQPVPALASSCCPRHLRRVRGARRGGESDAREVLERVVWAEKQPVFGRSDLCSHPLDRRPPAAPRSAASGALSALAQQRASTSRL